MDRQKGSHCASFRQWLWRDSPCHGLPLETCPSPYPRRPAPFIRTLVSELFFVFTFLIWGLALASTQGACWPRNCILPSSYLPLLSHVFFFPLSASGFLYPTLRAGPVGTLYFLCCCERAFRVFLFPLFPFIQGTLPPFPPHLFCNLPTAQLDLLLASPPLQVLPSTRRRPFPLRPLSVERFS